MILVFGDLFLVMLCTIAATVIVTKYYSGTGVPVYPHNEMVPVMIVVVGLFLNINGLFSLVRKNYGEVFVGLIMTMASMLVVMMAVSFFLREFTYSRSVLFTAAILQFASLAIWNYLFWRFEHASMLPRRALVIGSETDCQRLITRMQRLSHLQDHVKYVCTDGNGQWRKAAADVDLIIVGSTLKLTRKAEIVHYCHVNGKQVFIIPETYELFCSGVDLDKIDDIPVFRPRYLKPTIEQRLLKRLVDIFVSTVALIGLLPVLAAVAVAVRVDSPGPIFFSQTRSGLKGKEFTLYKFRTMRQDAEENTGPVLAAENDPRITRVGHFLRASRLDELPQLINVLVGDMSIVGPRPERPFFVERFLQEIPEYVYRSNVKPGITGMAQIHGKYNTTPHDKLIYDLIYIQNFNVLLDLILMFQTLKVLVSKASTEGVSRQAAPPILSQYEISPRPIQNETPFVRPINWFKASQGGEFNTSAGDAHERLTARRK
jgi:exopolysaccharide biosynthesis polyprenyl glycosylphosphotransferase